MDERDHHIRRTGTPATTPPPAVAQGRSTWTPAQWATRFPRGGESRLHRVLDVVLDELDTLGDRVAGAVGLR